MSDFFSKDYQPLLLRSVLSTAHLYYIDALGCGIFLCSSKKMLCRLTFYNSLIFDSCIVLCQMYSMYV